MFESGRVDSGGEWCYCVEVVVRGGVDVRCGEFGVEEGVEDERLGGVVFAEVFRGDREVVWHVAGVVDNFRPCIEEVVKVLVCES